MDNTSQDMKDTVDWWCDSFVQNIKNCTSFQRTALSGLSEKKKKKKPSLVSCWPMESIRHSPKAFCNQTLRDLCRFTPLIHVSNQPNLQDHDTVVPSCLQLDTGNVTGWQQSVSPSHIMLNLTFQVTFIVDAVSRAVLNWVMFLFCQLSLPPNCTQILFTSN